MLQKMLRRATRWMPRSSHTLALMEGIQRLTTHLQPLRLQARLHSIHPRYLRRLRRPHRRLRRPHRRLPCLQARGLHLVTRHLKLRMMAKQFAAAIGLAIGAIVPSICTMASGIGRSQVPRQQTIRIRPSATLPLVAWTRPMMLLSHRVDRQDAPLALEVTFAPGSASLGAPPPRTTRSPPVAQPFIIGLSTLLMHMQTKSSATGGKVSWWIRSMRSIPQAHRSRARGRHKCEA